MEIYQKRCSRCQEYKPRTEFQNHSQTRDGLRCYCKPCQKQKKKEYFRRHPEKLLEKKLKNKRRPNRRKSPSYKKKEARREKERYQNDPVYREMKKQKWREAQRMFPERVRARQMLRRAIDSGKVQKLPCPCGNPKSQGHHDDYTKPFEVKWVCASCHMKEHTKHLLKVSP